MTHVQLSRPGSFAVDYLADLSSVLRSVPQDPLADAIDLLLAARERGSRVYVFGNGGSAATASHLVCDLVKTAQIHGLAPIRAFALADSVPLMTAWANDESFACTFSRMLEGILEPDDVVIGISASGNSPNVVSALQTANRLGAHTIALLGFDGGAALHVAQVAIHVPCAHYGLAEDTHSAVGHAITAAVRLVLEREQARSLVTALG